MEREGVVEKLEILALATLNLFLLNSITVRYKLLCRQRFRFAGFRFRALANARPRLSFEIHLTFFTSRLVCKTALGKPNRILITNFPVLSLSLFLPLYNQKLCLATFYESRNFVTNHSVELLTSSLIEIFKASRRHSMIVLNVTSSEFSISEPRQNENLGRP